MRVCPCLIVVLVIPVASSLFAQSGSMRANDAAWRDVQHTMLARKLLQDEPDLARLNIGVVVQNRVATLFGPVSSVDAIFRAELCLRSMIGLIEIRNEMFVSDLIEPMRAPVKMRTPAVNPPDVAPPMLPVEPPKPFAKPEERLGQERKPSRQPMAQKTSQPKPSLGHPVVQSDLASAVREFLRSKSLFEKVKFTIAGQHVYLSATEEDAEVLHEASRAIARLPGVAGVILMDRIPSR